MWTVSYQQLWGNKCMVVQASLVTSLTKTWAQRTMWGDTCCATITPTVAPLVLTAHGQRCAELPSLHRILFDTQTFRRGSAPCLGAQRTSVLALSLLLTKALKTSVSLQSRCSRNSHWCSRNNMKLFRLLSSGSIIDHFIIKYCLLLLLLLLFFINLIIF